MENSTTSPNTASEDTGILSHVCSPSSEDSSVPTNNSTCSNTESALKITSEARDIQFSDDKHGLIVDKIAITYGFIVEDIKEQSSGHNAVTKQDKMCDSDETTCKVLPQSVFSGSTTAKSFYKCATFPCSEEVQSFPSIKKRDGLLSKLLQEKTSSDSESHAYARSLSVPASFKPISALKGGREQNGITPKTSLHVKWSPEVYDPPTTSVSHSVKNHHQRPKAKKKDHNKHKHKSKSSRGTNGDKNHASRRSTSNVISGIMDPLDMRLRASVEKLPNSGCKEHDVEVLEYSAGGREAKCGSSVLRETLSKVHLPIAEAS